MNLGLISPGVIFATPMAPSFKGRYKYSNTVFLKATVVERLMPVNQYWKNVTIAEFKLDD